MNDFTKEELEIAKDGIGWMISECEMSHNKLIADEWRLVKDKIQSLIDNYCEHENDGEIWEGNSDNDMPDEFRCIKCGKFYL